MRVLILTSPHHIYSNYIIKKVLERKDLCKVVGFIESSALLPGKTILSSVWKYLRIAGPWFFLVQAAKSWIYRMGCALYSLSRRTDRNHIAFGYQRIAKEYGIPLHETVDINCKKTRDFIRSCHPDLILIVFFGLILNQETIQLAPMGVFNIHPSLLPKYRGLMPVFQALLHNEEEAGITIHKVDEGIDSGPIIRQIRTKILRNDSEHSLYAHLCVEISKILPEVLQSILQQKNDIQSKTCAENGSYFSIPKRASVKKFRQNGNKFFTLNQLISPFESFRRTG